MNLNTIEKVLIKKMTWKIARPSRFMWHSIIKLSRNFILYIINYKFPQKKFNETNTINDIYLIIYYQGFYNTIGYNGK